MKFLSMPIFEIFNLYRNRIYISPPHSNNILFKGWKFERIEYIDPPFIWGGPIYFCSPNFQPWKVYYIYIIFIGLRVEILPIFILLKSATSPIYYSRGDTLSGLFLVISGAEILSAPITNWSYTSYVGEDPSTSHLQFHILQI